MRIISLVPSVTETLFELGLDDQIIAVTTFCRYPESKVAQKIKVGGTKNPDRQKILNLKPDVILLNEEENRKEDAEFFKSHSIPIKVTFPSTVAEAADLVQELGTQFGANQKGELIHAEIRELAANIHPSIRWRTLILIWKRPYWTVNSSTYVDSICKLFGLDNAFGDSGDRYPRLSDDDILTANPEVVLFPDEPYVFRDKDVEEFKKQFPNLKAVTEQRLLKLDGTYITWHGVRTLTALKELPLILRNSLLLSGEI